ncbi:histone acetyltransferase type B catalytic subunit [Tribolium castaneum]|uniref:histone acetyltransferase n=1 Tax=Tribolium castaneum TaxID=7070 RepID=D7EIT0_TRICA|nr:PREDICTED: histone acetyltransferase type B catalytic subunit [Tribolium castaneum]EFA12371.1 Histone acetyltransferase type B catalytic subunit-like Protein [Tribolium castaneum]|eukprot:XP_966673.1 PREDICTED: histone acetyltransferase type B catalytic subunit [Tribolium castaneum]
MAKNNLNGDSDVSSNCEDDEMVLYKKLSLNVITFRTVRDKQDLEDPPRKGSSFKPDMAHQIFGETEMIFGYKKLAINLFYLHNSAKCYVEVQTGGKIHENADDIMKALNPWLPENYRTEKSDFLADLDEEKPGLMFGDVIDTFSTDSENVYKVTVCDLKNPDFRQFHQRFETLIVWFIDGANFIDLEDPRWVIFYVYEEGPESHFTPVGFCTVYKFFLYPNLTRPRISQFFVLPTHQKRGIGTNLYKAVYNYLKQMPDSGDITVEEPTEVFQKIRDFCDSLHIYEDLEGKGINITTQNLKQINEFLKKHKIGKRQAQRVFDILECLTAHKNGYKEYVKFTEGIRSRIANEIEKETRGSKRLCNLERAGIVTEPIDKKAAIDAEYNKYVDSLEWPVNRLRALLVKK